MNLAIKNKVLLGVEIVQSVHLCNNSPIGRDKIKENHMGKDVEAIQWTLQ